MIYDVRLGATREMAIRSTLFSCVLVCCIGSPVSKAEIVFDNGPPDRLNGFELTHWVEANQFNLSSAYVVTGVEFWEAEASTTFYGLMLWEIRRNNSNNTPGTIVASGVSANLIRTPTFVAIYGIYPEYNVTFDLPSAVSLPPGNYWLTLHNGPLSNNATRFVFWETTTNGILSPSLSDEAPFAGNWDSNSSLSDPNSQMAFRLSGVPAAWQARIVSINRSGGSTEIVFTTAVNHHYRVDYSSSLLNPIWLTLPNASNISGSDAAIAISDPGAAGVSQRFYRVVLIDGQSNTAQKELVLPWPRDYKSAR